MPGRRTMHSENNREDDAESIGTLLRRLGSDTAALVQAEIDLAKLEVREVVKQAALDGAKLGAAVAIAGVGLLTLVAWAVLALGDVLGGRHATAALIIGVAFLVIGAILAAAGGKGLRRAGKPETTIRSLQEDRRMATEQLRNFREELQRPRAEPAPLAAADAKPRLGRRNPHSTTPAPLAPEPPTTRES